MVYTGGTLRGELKAIAYDFNNNTAMLLSNTSVLMIATRFVCLCACYYNASVVLVCHNQN